MLASKGEMVAPCGVPSSMFVQRPSTSTPALNELHQPPVVDVVEEPTDVCIEHPVHLPPAEPDEERVQRIVLATSRPEPIGEAQEVVLVDGVQHLDRRSLDDLVLQRGDSERSLPPVGLGNEHSS